MSCRWWSTSPAPRRPWAGATWNARRFSSGRQDNFDLVMMLAVAHHILVTERIPLEDLLALADELSKEYVLIEFVAPADPMFQRIVRGRDELYSHFSPAWFEAAARSRFELVRSAQDRRTASMALSLSPAARRQLTNGLTAFSLGTLCFIRRWYDLEHLQPRGLDYFRYRARKPGASGIHNRGGAAACRRVLGSVAMGRAKFHPRRSACSRRLFFCRC